MAPVFELRNSGLDKVADCSGVFAFVDGVCHLVGVVSDGAEGSVEEYECFTHRGNHATYYIFFRYHPPAW